MFNEDHEKACHAEWYKKDDPVAFALVKSGSYEYERDFELSEKTWLACASSIKTERNISIGKYISPLERTERIDIKNWDYVPPNLYIQIEFKDYFTDKGVDIGDSVKIDTSTDLVPSISVYANNGVIYQALIKEWKFICNPKLDLFKLFINENSECLVINEIPLNEFFKLQDEISTATGFKNAELKQVIEP